MVWIPTSCYRTRGFYRCTCRIPPWLWTRNSTRDCHDDTSTWVTTMVWVLYRRQARYLWTLGGRVTPCEKKYYLTGYWMLLRWGTHSLLSRDGRVLSGSREQGLQGTSTLEEYNLTFPLMQYLLLIVSLLTIGFTSLVSIPGSPYLIGGMTQADISNMFPSAITPAGVTFSIWSLIYLSWIVAGVYVAFFQKKKETSKTLCVFSLAILLTGVWLVPWGYIWIGTSLVVMLVILGLLKYTFHHTRDSHPALKYSVELTLGWINIATVANVTIWLLSLGFTGAGIPEVYWAIGVLALALGLTLYYQLRYRAYIISAVFLWTMIGEWIAHDNFLQRGFVIGYAIISIGAIVYTYMKK